MYLLVTKYTIHKILCMLSIVLDSKLGKKGNQTFQYVRPIHKLNCPLVFSHQKHLIVISVRVCD